MTTLKVFFSIVGFFFLTKAQITNMVFTKCFQKYEVIRFKLISKKKYKAFQKKKRIKEHFY